MRVDSLFIAGMGTFLPPAVDVGQAVAEGRYPPEEAAETELQSVLVAGREAPPEMAVQAAREALERSGVPPEAICLCLHASICFQGLEFYPVASYIHHAAVGPSSALALEVKALSNGGLCALEVAASYLAADRSRTAALLTTADKFCLPWIDRWRSDTGMVMADGAAALVLSRRGGVARVLSVATVGDSSLEGLHRGEDAFTEAPLPIDVHRRKRAYLAQVGLDHMLRRFRSGLRASVDRALSDARTDLRELARFVLPNVGRILLQREYFEALEIPEARTTWSWGRRIGHLGAGDQIAGLAHLIDSGAVSPGDRCLLMGVGAGFSWTCAVIEIETRDWPNPEETTRT
jgi:3-oxoacyl-[acyl-carrier-protein] synthase III